MRSPSTLPHILLACMLSLAAAPREATGQAAILGRVTDAETGEALADAHVFIAASMNGSTTDMEGRFQLTSVHLGAHRLYVSILGYEPQARDVFIRTGGFHRHNFRLVPSVIEIEEVEVVGKRNARWDRQLKKFTRLFIGETPNATQVTIVNPEVLDFTDRLGRFTAQASETLVIENRALGYRVRYFLKEFEFTMNRVRWDGEPLFETLTPSSPEEASRWRENRIKAFHGVLPALHAGAGQRPRGGGGLPDLSAVGCPQPHYPNARIERQPVSDRCKQTDPGRHHRTGIRPWISTASSRSSTRGSSRTRHTWLGAAVEDARNTKPPCSYSNRALRSWIGRGIR